jgi:hypothetical protein
MIIQFANIDIIIIPINKNTINRLLTSAAVLLIGPELIAEYQSVKTSA